MKKYKLLAREYIQSFDYNPKMVLIIRIKRQSRQCNTYIHLHLLTRAWNHSRWYNSYITQVSPKKKLNVFFFIFLLGIESVIKLSGCELLNSVGGYLSSPQIKGLVPFDPNLIKFNTNKNTQFLIHLSWTYKKMIS